MASGATRKLCGSSSGARSRAFGRSSRAANTSTRGIPRFMSATSRAVSGEPARTIADAPSREAGLRAATKEGSSPMAVSLPDSSAVSEMRRSSAPRLLELPISRISRPRRDSAPTRAITASANLVLRGGGMSGTETAENAGDPDDDATEDVGASHNEQNGLRMIVNEGDQSAQKNDGKRRARMQEIEVL